MKVGSSVKGIYCGDFEFTGVITSERYMGPSCTEYYVKLDTPIVVFGEVREEIIMNTRADGSQSTYTRDIACYMEAV